MKVIYFSLVGWNWIKQRPQFITEGLAKHVKKIEYVSVFPLFKSKSKKIRLKENFFY